MHSINEYATDNNLLNSNKYLNDLKLQNYQLNREYSLDYYEDEEFRNQVHSKLTNNQMHLALNLTGCINITDEVLSRLGRVNKLQLNWCYQITDEGLKHL